MEFLEMFQTEPCLWDPRMKSHKNRGAQSDAWRRIVQALPFPASVEELKKKKDSLMGYYRIHSNIYKKSLKSGTGTSDVYTTNWFAFEIMHRFLKPIYESNSTLNTENQSPLSENVVELEASEGEETNSHRESPTPGHQTLSVQASGSSTPRPQSLSGRAFGSSTPRPQSLSGQASISSTPRPQSLSGQGVKRPSSTQSVHNQSAEHNRFVMKNLPTEITAAKKQMDEAFKCIKSLSSQKERRDFDEYDHFASMIAAKIRNIGDLDEKEMLMSSIQNLVFQSVTKDRNRITSRCSPLLSWSATRNKAPVDIESCSPHSVLSNDAQESSYSAPLETGYTDNINIEETETNISAQEFTHTPQPMPLNSRI